MAAGTTPKSPWFTQASGYPEQPTTWWKGRRVGGVAIGIVQLEARIPMPPGDIGNASTFDFPILFDTLGDVDPHLILADEPNDEVTEVILATIERLEMQGVRAVVGNCGFFANYQPQVATRTKVPFYSSSLMLLPMIIASLGADQKVGVLTADGPKLKRAPAIANCGVSEEAMQRLVVYGAEECPQMKNVVGEVGEWDLKTFEGELIGVAKDMIAEHPDISTILLECTEFPVVAHAMQEEVQMPIWGYPDLVNWIQGGVVRRPFSGWI